MYIYTYIQVHKKIVKVRQLVNYYLDYFRKEGNTQCKQNS